MLTKEVYDSAQARATTYLDRANIIITEQERDRMEVVEYGLGMLEKIGLQLVVYLNTDRCCAKELILFPGQTCPEHAHPPIATEPGKEETFRCRYGTVHLYVPGPATVDYKAELPAGKEDCFTVFHEVILQPGEQYTLPPNTLHWFQAGEKGAVVSEFSTQSRDEFDVYTDPDIDPAVKRKL